MSETVKLEMPKNVWNALNAISKIYRETPEQYILRSVKDIIESDAEANFLGPVSVMAEEVKQLLKEEG